MKKILQILNFLQYECVNVVNDINIDFLTQNSKNCKINSVFIALKGQVHDGNDYIDEAIKNGATAVLCESKPLDFINIYPDSIYVISNLKDKISLLSQWFYDYEPDYFDVIAVTGTNGKTSIAHYISQAMLNFNFNVLTLGTAGNGIYPNLNESLYTTLDNFEIYRYFNSCYNQNILQVVMEVSSHSLSQNRIANLHIQTAVFTNLSPEHLDYHINMDNYFATKIKLFLKQNLKNAIINIDNEYGLKLKKIINHKNKKVKITTYSTKDIKSDICLLPISSSSDGFTADFYLHGNKVTDLNSKMIGDFNISNMAAMLAVLFVHIPFFPKNISKIFKKIEPVEGRMQILKPENSQPVVIDFAHTPDAMEKVLLEINKNHKGKIWCLFGCGGNRDRSKRPEMAKIAEKYADKIIVSEDNNRYEKIDDIFNDIKKGISAPDKSIFIADRKKAIEYALANMCMDSILVLLGKGCEKYLYKNGSKIPFDEQEIIKNYLNLSQ